MIQAPKGTKDIHSEEMKIWHVVENHIRNITNAFNFQEIRTPMFESTDLFLRGVGDTTDIVQKEMYTFNDKSNRSMTLRPELTAGVARAYIENGMASNPKPNKFWYIGQCFRYEKPQAGRYRQHYQFGVEVYGSSSPAAEAEVLSLGWELLQALGIKDVKLHINSIGCIPCRKVYHEKLKDFLKEQFESFCGLCQDRFEKNPLRILDCKNPSCQKLLENAPSVLDILSENCKNHFNELQEILKIFNIPFIVDAKIVRGLDYYTCTVFEFIKSGEATVLGGGRYDGLISQLGGAETPAVGFGMGLERLVLLLKNQENELDLQKDPLFFIGSTGKEGFIKAQELVYKLRKKGIQAESDLIGRSVKAQMKYADKIKAQHTMIIGETELLNNSAEIKHMETGEKKLVSFFDLLNIEV